ncbi:DUF987 family protein [Escherichia coli]|nr:DUF987 family protein [Escherichia coli]
MKIITRGEAMRIHRQHPASRLFPFCTGKYRWHGSAEAYTGREVQDIPGVLAVFAERRKDSFGPYLPFITTCYRELKMNTLPDTHVREASGCPSPVTIWQTLLTRLLDQHYGLTLNDTPFADERVIEQHIEAGISLCDAVNFLVEKYALVRTDQPGFSAGAPSQLINSIDILRARRATGLMTRNNYRMVNNITQGKHPEAKR